MKILMITGMTLSLSALISCTDTEQSVTTEKAVSTEQEKISNAQQINSHTISGMKKALDDARGVEDLLQQQHEQQRKEIDGL